MLESLLAGSVRACVSGVCNVPIFACASRPSEIGLGSAGRLVKGRVGVTSDAIRTAWAQEAQCD